MRYVKILALAFIGILGNSCGGGGDDLILLPPTKASLIFPRENSECTEGSSQTDTHSMIKFEWSLSENTDSYDIVIKNLITGVSATYTATSTTKEIRLERAIPYSWKVISKATAINRTAESATWKFYNAGLGAVAYPPFPAEIIEPKMGEYITPVSNVVNLKWNGSALENNIKGYDVYFGTENPPVLFKANHTSMELNNVPVMNQTVYFWKVITKDGNGNTSESSIYQFKTN